MRTFVTDRQTDGTEAILKDQGVGPIRYLEQVINLNSNEFILHKINKIIIALIEQSPHCIDMLPESSPPPPSSKQA